MYTKEETVNTPSLTVQSDLVVLLDYTLSVDGKMVETTAASGPLEYLQGHHNILPGLERQLTGMSPGETRKILVAAREAYGEFDPQALMEVPRSQIPPEVPLTPDMRFRVQDDQGRVRIASLETFDEQAVRLNLNHPLAGKDLDFSATIVSLRPPTEEERARGRVGRCASCSPDRCGTEPCGENY
jgi:FKBP-type peptidyl-prolyl cis-trans isomerase SlyD